MRELATQMLTVINNIHRRLLTVIELCDSCIIDIDQGYANAHQPMVQRLEIIRHELFLSRREASTVAEEAPRINALIQRISDQNLMDHFTNMV